jgi:anti-anti-sigma factor
MNDQLAQASREQHDDVVIIRLRGEIDLSNAEELQPRLERMVGDAREVAVDLTEIVFIDSRGLRLLHRLATMLAAKGGTLELIAPPESVARDVLEITRMSDEIPIRDS